MTRLIDDYPNSVTREIETIRTIILLENQLFICVFREKVTGERAHLSRARVVRWRSFSKGMAEIWSGSATGLTPVPLRTNSSHTEVYLNGNTVGISHTALTIVRWLCSLAHSHAAKSHAHTRQRPSLSLRFSLQSAFLSLFIFILASLVIYYSRRWLCKRAARQGRAARRAPLLRLPEKLSCRFKNGISLVFFAIAPAFRNKTTNNESDPSTNWKEKKVETYSRDVIFCLHHVETFHTVSSYRCDTHACTYACMYISAFRPRATAL